VTKETVCSARQEVDKMKFVGKLQNCYLLSQVVYFFVVISTCINFVLLIQNTKYKDQSINGNIAERLFGQLTLNPRDVKYII